MEIFKLQRNKHFLNSVGSKNSVIVNLHLVCLLCMTAYRLDLARPEISQKTTSCHIYSLLMKYNIFLETHCFIYVSMEINNTL